MSINQNRELLSQDGPADPMRGWSTVADLEFLKIIVESGGFFWFSTTPCLIEAVTRLQSAGLVAVSVRDGGKWRRAEVTPLGLARVKP